MFHPFPRFSLLYPVHLITTYVEASGGQTDRFLGEFDFDEFDGVWPLFEQPWALSKAERKVVDLDDLHLDGAVMVRLSSFPLFPFIHR